MDNLNSERGKARGESVVVSGMVKDAKGEPETSTHQAYTFAFEGKMYSIRKVGKPDGRDANSGFYEYYREPEGKWTGDISLGPTYEQAVNDFKAPSDQKGVKSAIEE